MADMRISIEKGLKSFALFILGTWVAGFMGMPEAGLTLGAVVTASWNFVTHAFE
jgi:hypothetical protein